MDIAPLGLSNLGGTYVVPLWNYRVPVARVIPMPAGFPDMVVPGEDRDMVIPAEDRGFLLPPDDPMEL